MGDEVVVYNDISEAGLRRVMALRAVEPVDREKWIRYALAEGGTIEMALTCPPDELGMNYFYLAWRCAMGELWVVTLNGAADLQRWVELVGDAAQKYMRRFKHWPNQALVRDGVELPAGLEQRGVKIMDGEGAVQAEIRIRRVRWMCSGDLGVTFEEVDGG